MYEINKKNNIYQSKGNKNVFFEEKTTKKRIERKNIIKLK
jgi:hypothetical protein